MARTIAARLETTATARRKVENRFARIITRSPEVATDTTRTIRLIVGNKRLPEVAALRLARACAHILQIAEAGVVESGDYFLKVPNIATAREIKAGKLRRTAATVASLAEGQRGKAKARYLADADSWRKTSEILDTLTDAKVRKVAKALVAAIQ